MKELLDIIFPTLSDELIIVISLIIGLLVTASLILFLVKKISPKTNISELSARTRSWWIMAGMFIGAVFISYNISYFFLAFLSFIAFRELYSVLGFREADRGALFWGILAIPIQYYLAYLAWYGAFIIFIPEWSIHHLHSGSYVSRIALTTCFKGRHPRNYQVDGSVAVDSDAFSIRYQPPRLSPVASRTSGIQCRRTRSAIIPCIPYGNQRCYAIYLGQTSRTT